MSLWLIRSRRKGSAIVVASGLALVLLIIVGGFFSFNIESMRHASKEAKDYLATTYAEAGLNHCIGELRKNPSFMTHTEVEPLSGQKSYKLELKGNSSFSVQDSRVGTIKGTIGEGEFRYAVSRIRMEDDRDTRNVNESDRYYRVVCYGKFQDSIRKISAVVQKNQIGKQYLMYNGGVLSLIYGNTGNNNKNLLGSGDFYGHEGIELGRVSMEAHQQKSPGTGIEFFDFNMMATNGGLWIYHDTPVELTSNQGRFDLKQNFRYPANGTYPNNKAASGEYPEEMKDPVELANGEGDSGKVNNHVFHAFNRTAPSVIKEIPLPFYKKKAQSGGVFIDNSFSKKTRYQSPYKDHGPAKDGYFDCVRINFGPLNNGAAGGEDDPPEYRPGNGVLYSTLSLVILGNPDRDLTLVSEKDIFVIGDFNQAGGAVDTYGFPQNYEGNDPKGAKNYATSLANRLENDTGQYHKVVTLLADNRFFYDYRNPLFFLKNEIKPFMVYEFALISQGTAPGAVPTFDANVYNNFLVAGSPGRIDVANPDGMKLKLAAFFGTSGPFFCSGLVNSGTVDPVVDDFIKKIKDGGNKLTRTVADEFFETVWKKAETGSPADGANSGIWKYPQRFRDFYQVLENQSGAAKDRDFIFYPEYTVNAMLMSNAKTNGVAYRGPDQSLIFEEIGNATPTGGDKASLAAEFAYHPYYAGSDWGQFLLRSYGSELRLGNKENVLPYLSGKVYKPGLRKKVYDRSLPKNTDENAPVTFAIVSWSNYSGTANEWQRFD